MDLYQIEKELRKTSNRLKDAMRKKKSQEIINKLQNYVRKLAQTVLFNNQSMYTTKWSDVDFLNSLELKYLMTWYISDLKLAQNITITSEYIRIAWLELRRYNEQTPNTKDSSIFRTKDGKHSLFKIGAAKNI